MNRNIFITLVLLSLGAGRLAAAQETSPAATDWSSFQAIAQKNIFDPSRTRGGRPARSAPKSVVVRTFTFQGAIDDTAFFAGDGAPRKGYMKVGELINGFKVRQITLHAVKLAEPDGKIQVLKIDESMRREDDGPWTKSDQRARVTPVAQARATITTTETTADDAGASSSPGPAGESDILRKLRLRKQEEK